jgi:phenylalanyl-tRNA synthetase beta chain
MYASFNWIKKYIKTSLEPHPQELMQTLTLHSFEVEGIQSEQAIYENIVIGQIFSLQKHPDADSLKLCQVDIGSDMVQIVCGGSNLEKNMLVAIALPGAKVRWHGEGDLVSLKETKIRGENSFGMICAANEIGLGHSQGKEILDLSYTKTQPGTSIAEVFEKKDLILDIDNKSITNRPDLWSHQGLAREIAAVTKTKFEPFQASKKIKIPKTGETANITLKNPEIIRRFCSIIIDNLEVKPSPPVIQEKLNKCNIKSVNNIVDATHIVMLELGMPMHAYDFDSISKDKQADLTIQFADPKSAPVTTLENKTIQLKANDPVICADKTPLLLLGTMGFANSAVHDKSTKILLEAASFDQNILRKSNKNHNIRSESFQRHEKTVDPELATDAIYLFIETLQLSCPDLKICGPVQDSYPNPYPNKKIALELNKLNSYLGVDLTTKQAAEILDSIGFESTYNKTTLGTTPPSFRSTGDISIPEDLIEEIGRLYGYYNIPSQLPPPITKKQYENKSRKFEHSLREYLANIGLYEAVNYSFYGPETAEACDLSLSNHIVLSNGLSKEASHMRTSLLPGMLENLKANHQQAKPLQFFEIGRTYTEIGNFFPAEELKLAIILESESENFFQLKGIVQSILDKYNYKSIKLQASKQSSQNQHPHKILDIISSDKQELGQIFGVSPVTLKNMDLNPNSFVSYAHINLGHLEHLPNNNIKLKPISKFPEISFDVSVVIDQNTNYQEIYKQIHKSSDLITNINLFDNYTGPNIQENQKALAFKITLQSLDRTLEDSDLHNAQTQIFANLEKIGGTIRGK